MRRIDEMVSRLCPDGVEYKKLGEIGSFTRGSGIQKKDFVEDGRPCIHYGQVYTFYGLSATKTKSFISKELYAGRKKAEPGDLVIATTSENEEDVCKCVAWLGDEPCAVSGDAYIFSHEQDSKYVAYLFCSDQFQEQKMRYITGTKVLRVSGESMAKIELPFPPLDIQREVVRVLDSFTELEAELEARKVQYAHYRDRLLSRESLEEMEGGEIEIEPLKAVASIRGGHTPSKSDSANYDGGDILWVTSKDVKTSNLDNTGIRITEKGAASLTLYPAGTIVVVVRSGILKRHLPVAQLMAPATVNQDIKAVYPLDVSRLLPRYLFYCINANSGRLIDTGHRVVGTVYSIPIAEFEKMPVPVPSLSVQRQIVDILDRFDALATSLTEGLPAEIEARRQQYEYYRDKLLDFPRKEVA